MNRRNALIFHSGGLGDFVLTWPLGLALGRLYPQSRVIYVTQASKGRLAERALRLDWRDAETSWPALYAQSPRLSDMAFTAVAQAHSVFTFLADFGDAFCRNVAELAPDVTIVPLRTAPPPDYAGHAIQYMLGQLSAAPIVRTAAEQILASINSRGLGARRTSLQPMILVHPGSGDRDKCWPVESFLRLIERLSQTVTVKILLGEVELERFAADDLRRLESAAPVIKPADYVELYDQLVQATAFVGNDSGPAHLAGIIGLPALVLFGGTDPAVWKPLGPRVATLRSEDLAQLDVNQVHAAVVGLS